MNQHLRNAATWLSMGLTVWGLLLVVPDWFGRPDWGWWLVTAGALAGLTLSITTFVRRDPDTGVVIGVFGFVGFATLLGGLAIVITAIVRLNAFRDDAALPLGFGCLIVGGLIGLALLGAAIRLLGQHPGGRTPPG